MEIALRKLPLPAAFAALLLVVGTLLVAGTASAVPVTIDFSTFSEADGEQTYRANTAIGGLTLATSRGAKLSVTPSGIEVSGSALLQLRFEPTAHLSSFTLSDFGRGDLAVARGDQFYQWVGGSADTIVQSVGQDTSYLAIRGYGQFSLRSATFDADLQIPNPEPGAALLFAAGALIVGVALRRSSRDA